jgi:uncharacterized SAM-binding protein YcdF (DUF218 family)
MPYKSVWVAISIFLFWFGGFLWFVYDMPRVPPCPDCTTDAIVVLTGGDKRIASAFDLLEQKLSNHLLISGVKPGTSIHAIKSASGFQRPVPTEKITLDNASRSTKENALYTSKWIAENNFHSIRLVTANYHMPRSLLEFHQVMPNIVIIPHPIVPKGSLFYTWCKDYKIFCLFFTEYNKYLGALLRYNLKVQFNTLLST